jgi:DNA-binding MarR family transcriptional regulator
MNNNTPKERTLGHLTGLVAHALAWQLRRNFEAEGLDLTHAQLGLLSDLFIEDGLTQQQLAQKVWKDKAAVKRLVDLLESKGYIERTEGTDPRSYRICLTPLARKMEKELKRISEKTLLQATAGIDEGELAVCIKVLKQIQSKFAAINSEE